MKEKCPLNSGHDIVENLCLCFDNRDEKSSKLVSRWVKEVLALNIQQLLFPVCIVIVVAVFVTQYVTKSKHAFTAKFVSFIVLAIYVYLQP